MSTSIQFMTSANNSAYSSEVKDTVSFAAPKSSLALSRSYTSIGIAPGRAWTLGNRPGAPYVKIFAIKVASPGAFASAPTNTFKSVSRLFVFRLENIDLIPRPRFLGAGSSAAGVGVDSGSLAVGTSSSFGGSDSTAFGGSSMISSTNESSSRAGAVGFGVVGLEPAPSPIISLNWRCRSSSATAAFALMVLNA